MKGDVQSLAGLIAKKESCLAPHVQTASGPVPFPELHRRIAGRDFFWLVNNSGNKQEYALTIPGAKGEASVWNCDSGDIRPIPSAEKAEGSGVRLAFDPFEAYWLVFDPQGKPLPGETASAGEGATAAELKGPWTVSIDPATQPPPPFPGFTPAYSNDWIKGQTRPLADWHDWGLDGFSGFVDYEAEFTLQDIGGRFLLDLGAVNHMAEIWVNGKPAGERLWPPFKFEIGALLKNGKNSLRIRVGNLLDHAIGGPQARGTPSGLMGPVVVRRTP